jgi:hypothetical protein
MKTNIERLFLFVKVSFMILFFLFLSCYVAWTTLGSIGANIPDIITLFSSIYVFIFLAVTELLFAIKTSSIEQLIFAVLSLVAGLNILVRGFMLLLSGRSEIVFFVSFGLGIVSTLGSLYIVIFKGLINEKH